jgi:hypothetical protein
MKYNSYQVSIVGANGMLKFFEFLAVDHKAAIADVQATYGDDVEIVSVCLL